MKQHEFEKSIFLEFSKVAELDIISTSIQSRTPPEPDILCEIRDEGFLALELTEFVAQRYMEKFKEYVKTKQMIEEVCGSLSEEDKEKFSKLFKGALLSFYFNKKANLRQKRKLLEKDFPQLLTLNPNYIGEYILSSEIEVMIYKCDFDDTFFEVDNVEWLENPLENLLNKKFRKRYSTAHRIELLLHTYHSQFWPRNILIPQIQKYLKLHSPVSNIQGLWVFDYHEKEIISHICF